MKNTAVIEKIIGQLAYKDYLAYNPRDSKGRPKHAYRPYSLSAETNEAREVMYQYINDDITEEEYKSWCLKWNLAHIDT